MDTRKLIYCTGMGIYDTLYKHRKIILQQASSILVVRSNVLNFKITRGSNFMFKRFLDSRRETFFMNSTIQKKLNIKKSLYKRSEHVLTENKFNDIPENKKARIGRLVIQKHNASHKHFDISIIEEKNKEELFRGAVTKKELDSLFPKTSSKSTLFVRQPQHTIDYTLKTPDKFKIEEGYGKGTVEKVFNKQIEIHKTESNKISFSIYEDSIKGRYSLIKNKDSNWMCIRKKDPIADIVGRGKFKLIGGKNKTKEITIDMEKDINKFIKDKKTGKEYSYIVEEKYQGGNNYIKLGKDINTMWSHRISIKDNKPIFHHNRYNEIRDELHPELEGTVLRGELIYVQGKIIRISNKYCFTNMPQLENIISRFSHIKNPIESRALRKLEKGNIGYVVWDISKYKGKNVDNLNYKEKINFIDNITKKSKFIYSPRRYKDINTAWNEVVKKNKGEGIVVKRLDRITPHPTNKETGYWLKIKDHDFIDAKIIGYKDTVKITGVINPTMVGEFTVKDEQGNIFRCPATGMSHFQRKWAKNNIKQILKDNSIIKIRYEGKVSKIPLKPVYAGVHGEKTQGILNEMQLEQTASDLGVNKYALKNRKK